MEVNEIVEKFVDSMKFELKANEHKGDWRGWKNVEEIYLELNYHLEKFEIAIQSDNKAAIKEHIADCANFLMMFGNAHDLYNE